VILSAFKELAQSKIVSIMKQTYGKTVIPLPVVGHFLNYVGNSIVFYLYQLFSNQEQKCKIFYPMHRAVNIQLMANGDSLVKVE